MGPGEGAAGHAHSGATGEPLLLLPRSSQGPALASFWGPTQWRLPLPLPKGLCLCAYLYVSLCVCIYVSVLCMPVSTCSWDSQKPQPFSIWPTVGATRRSVSWKTSPTGPLTQSHFLLPPPSPMAGT